MRSRDVGVARQDVAVDLFELRDAAPGPSAGSKSYRFATRYAQRVADLAVRLDDARQDLLADADLLAVVAHRDPQPEDVGAALLDDVLRRDRCCRATSTSCGRRRRSTKPCVSTCSIRRPAARAERRRAASSGTSRDAGRCLRGRCRPARSAPAAPSSTASWLEPESNQTSRMFISRSNAVPPHVGHVSPAGRNSSVGRSYQASAPYCVEDARGLLDERRRERAPRRTSCSRAPGSARPRRAGARCTSPAGSRPCCRCGRGPTPGSTSPGGRSRRAPPRAASALAVVAAVIACRPCAMNHCDVARKITGLWQRQQCGY